MSIEAGLVDASTIPLAASRNVAASAVAQSIPLQVLSASERGPAAVIELSGDAAGLLSHSS